MANIPVYETKNFSFGPGVLYIGPVGTTPSIDIGAVREGAEVAIAREALEYRQGSLQNLVKLYITRENIEFTIRGLEWNLENIPYALGAGIVTTSATLDTFEFGGSLGLNEYAIMFKHEMPSGDVIYLDLYRVQPVPEVTVTFGLDPHEIPYRFRALDATTGWAGETLPEGGKLMRIRKVKA